MLTIRENLLETIRGGKPDRFVKQFEPFQLTSTPFSKHNPRPRPGEENIVNAWGVTQSWPQGNPGPFPIHTPERVVIKDITAWRDYVKAPNIRYSDAEWEPYIQKAEAIDRKEYFVTARVTPGVFEQCHYLGEIQQTLMNMYEEPDDMHDLIRYLTDFELARAEDICKYIKPDALFHHDDWGHQKSTFMSPAMFEEFFLEPYKEIYGYYKAHGVELIVHHSDSYGATLVPYMIDMGIDIWQGALSCNNIPELIRQYEGKISFMGAVESSVIDIAGWTQELVQKEVVRACSENGKLYYIPCLTQGGPASSFQGVYEAVNEEIDRYSKLCF